MYFNQTVRIGVNTINTNNSKYILYRNTLIINNNINK